MFRDLCETERKLASGMAILCTVLLCFNATFILDVKMFYFFFNVIVMFNIDNQLIKKLFSWGFCLFLLRAVLLSVAVFVIEVCFQLMFHLVSFLSKCQSFSI